MGCIADERCRGRAVTVLAKPVSRSAFELTPLTSLLLSAAATCSHTNQLFEALPLGDFVLLNQGLYISEARKSSC